MLTQSQRVKQNEERTIFRRSVHTRTLGHPTPIFTAYFSPNEATVCCREFLQCSAIACHLPPILCRAKKSALAGPPFGFRQLRIPRALDPAAFKVIAVAVCSDRAIGPLQPNAHSRHRFTDGRDANRRESSPETEIGISSFKLVSS